MPAEIRSSDNSAQVHNARAPAPDNREDGATHVHCKQRR